MKLQTFDDSSIQSIFVQHPVQ